MKQSEEENRYDKLMKEFPILYKQRTLPMSETCMCWGIECSEGWYRPLHDLSNKLESLNETFGKTYGFEIQAVQVKEKYGTLHFYWDIYKIDKEPTKLSYFNGIVENIVKEAEDQCFNTCEECGKSIGLEPFAYPKCETKGWITYLCEDCAKKRKSEYLIQDTEKTWIDPKEWHKKHDKADSNRQ